MEGGGQTDLQVFSNNARVRPSQKETIVSSTSSLKQESAFGPSREAIVIRKKVQEDDQLVCVSQRVYPWGYHCCADLKL
jgi:hypothetical protein